MSRVVLQNLTKRYGQHTAVDNITLAIEHGLLVCLLGPSGCGKTTTLRLIAGFVVPDGGTIGVGDRIISAANQAVPPERRNMSMIFQSYALWPHMTVAENVAYGVKLKRLPREEMARRVQKILDVTRIAPLADRYPSELSGGQQQRVALARALVVEPETLLLDEPLSNLDANLREEMRFEIRRLHDEYRYTTVYVTHDQSEAMTTADLIVVMNQGRIEQVGSAQEVYQRPRSEFVARFIGGTNIVKGHAIDANSIAVGEFKLRYGHGTPPTAGATIISIRQHDVRVIAKEPKDVAENVLTGHVVRRSFLGAERDYLIELPNGIQLRATTSAEQSAAVGTQVWLHLPPEHCRALAG
jgi:iron(III) transport system ATP-binding protein